MTTIRFEGVSKMFRQRRAQGPDGELWALKDIDFQCEEGQVLGVIGRNGCGKSTLLKLAANVTFPSRGTVTRVGPIAPMLELGAGFHPDLSGRDNIQLNGCLLGLGRRIPASLLDEIVAFAEVAQHLDTPVKHYSSGMYARLGFAIAVHSPARLLLVDEVLSVGDQSFRKKCFARMRHLRDRGTTIVLVSHDSWWIRNFCDRVLLLDMGSVVIDGRPEEALQAYDWRLGGFSGDRPRGVKVSGVEVLDCRGAEVGTLLTPSVRVRVLYDAQGAQAAWLLVARVRRDDGTYCASCVSENPAGGRAGVAVADIEDLHLAPGRYVLEVSIEDALSRVPLATRASEAFVVPPEAGQVDSSQAYDGVMKVRHRWSFD
jgi:ABC-type polysaccharide/polyol phosphate transport system ATPase subunit